MNVNCPYCNSNHYSGSYMPDTEFNGKTFQYLRCTSCEVLFLHPIPDDFDFIKMYPPSYQGELITQMNSRFDVLFNQLKIHYPKGKTLLDYGCGNAEFLLSASAHGYTCSGLEYNAEFISLLKNHLPQFTFYSILEFNEEKRNFDVIVLNNVLEHVSNPNALVSALHTRLNDGGLLVVMGPMEENFTIAQTCRRVMFGLRKKLLNIKATHVPYHLTFTNFKNQTAIFERNNFTKISFSIEEVAWPFPEKIRFTSIKNFVFGLLARISIKTSKLFYRHAGNTFVYIGRK